MLSPDFLPSAEIRAVGSAIASRVGDVVERVVDADCGPSSAFDGLLDDELATAVRVATAAVADWIADGDPSAARAVGRDTSRLFGRLAAHREVSLTEMTKSCLRWRDGMLEVAWAEAKRLCVSPNATQQVTSMLRHSCDATLVRLCGAFEEERRRVHDELTRRQSQLAFQASHDPLTSLPNRTRVLERAEQALASATRRGTLVAALFMDLDNFKYVNDTLGHNAGDVLLQRVAQRLATSVPANAALGRLGGDEFVLLLEDVGGVDEVSATAAGLLDAFRAPFWLPALDDRPLNVTLSIGIAVASGGSAEELLRDADVAMYRAKWTGKSCFTVFEQEMQSAARSRLELDIELQMALDGGEFFLVYQPTFDLGDMRVTGVEALLRWRHPTRGVVEPGEFIPQLEKTGLISIVGGWVLAEACRQGASWRVAGHDIAISVNVSARQLDDASFVDDVRSALESTGFSPGSLTIEITETAIVRDTVRSAARLGAIRALGVRIAVDDFGTGYSSLAHLQYFPVDALKIDRSFVSGMLNGREAGALVHTLVELGHALGIETLAEGIEDLTQLEHLRGERCGSGQGFLFAAPLPAEEIGAFFSSWSGEVAILGPA